MVLVAAISRSGKLEGVRRRRAGSGPAAGRAPTSPPGITLTHFSVRREFKVTGAIVQPMEPALLVDGTNVSWSPAQWQRETSRVSPLSSAGRAWIRPCSIECDYCTRARPIFRFVSKGRRQLGGQRAARGSQAYRHVQVGGFPANPERECGGQRDESVQDAACIGRAVTGRGTLLG